MAATRGQFWLMVCGAALVLAALLAVRALSGAGPLIADSDDAMRLVQVRDLVAGQGLQESGAAPVERAIWRIDALVTPA